VQPLAIINVLDEGGKTILDIVHRPVLPEVDLLGLQGLDEALGCRIVVGVALAGHADSEAVGKQLLHVVSGGILDPAIRVMDDSCRGSATRQGHPEGLQAQGRVDIARERIAHDPAGKEIQDDRQVHKAAQDGNVGVNHRLNRATDIRRNEASDRGLERGFGPLIHSADFTSFREMDLCSLTAGTAVLGCARASR